ncbi:hypothetical protein KR009_000695 [Drosophila setifemur]|nr:hypothetical protein KR009_000695 [Drosophila setifemur]
MESINEIINRQPFNQELVVDSTEFTHSNSQSLSQHHHQERGSNPVEAHALTMQTMTASSRTATSCGNKKHAFRAGSGSDSVLVVVDGLGHRNDQPAYHTVSQQLQLHSRTLQPLELLQQDQPQHQQCLNRIINSSPVDFDASDISLDGLSVETMSQAVFSHGVAVKQEHKLVIVQTRIPEHVSRRLSMHVDISSGNAGLDTDVDEMEEMSSDGDGCDESEITLNQHHHQLLEQQQQEYGLNRHHLQHQAQTHHGLQHRSVQMDLALEGEVLSVIVQSQGNGKDVDGDVDRDGDRDAEDEDDDGRESGDREQLLSPVLDRTSYQTLTSVNDRLSPPGFSPTSYATLTPIQPLPPISTMSDKFAYSGHISGGDGGASINGGEAGEVGEGREGNLSGDSIGVGSRANVNASSSACSNNDCSSFSGLSIPLGSSHLGLSVLNGVQSPYSSYEKLAAMISPPPHNYPGSPSNGLSGMVVSCDLHTHNVSGRLPLSPQLNSNNLQLNVNGQKKDSVATQVQGHGHERGHGHTPGLGQGDGHGHGHGHCHGLQLLPVTLQKEVICLSPGVVIDQSAVVSDYDSQYSGHHHDHELVMATSSSTSSSAGLQHSPTLSPHSVSAVSVVSMPLHSPTSVVNLPNINRSIANLPVELPVVVSLTPTPPPVTDETTAILRMNDRSSPGQRSQYFIAKGQEASGTTEQHSPHGLGTQHSRCADHQQPNSTVANGFQGGQQNAKMTSAFQKTVTACIGGSSRSGTATEMEEINTKELAQRISAELKRYSIPQAIFAQRVLCRSQGTLSDLLRNPKPWSKLKSGRETFRRMYKWLQEPEFQRMSALRMAAAQIPQRTSSAAGTADGGGTGLTTLSTVSTLSTDITDSQVGPTMSTNALLNGSTPSAASVPDSNVPVASVVNCRRKEEPHMEQIPQPKKPRLVFTDLQRRTLQAIFKETKRPSKEMQVTIARQLGLEPTTVGNFFMNARRRSMDKWRDDDSKSSSHAMQTLQQQIEGHDEDQSQRHSQTQNQNHNTMSNNIAHESYSSLHTTALSPLGTFDEEADMDLELENHDFDLADPNDHGDSTDHHGEML